MTAANANSHKSPVTASALIVERTFNAPRELVWKAFTEPERLMHWWGPKGFTMRGAKVDLRPGGVFHYSMQGPGGGAEMWGKFVYREIAPPERLVFVNSFSDAEGNITRHPMSATWPLEVINTLIFAEYDGKTTLTLHGGPINATAEESETFANASKNVQQGMAGTFDRLEEYLANA